MVRNALGGILALVGATAAVWSPFRAWYEGRQGRDYRVADLFGGITATKADLFTSLLLPLAVAALLTLIGLVLRSRLLVTLAGVVVLGFTVLWMVRQSQAADGLALETDGSGLGWGVVIALAGGVLLLLAALVMSGRRALRRRARERREREPETYPPDGDEYGHGQGQGYGYGGGHPDDGYRHGDPYGRDDTRSYGPDDPYGSQGPGHGQTPRG
ncbi:hypothetical protein [Streptomyces sp. NPDC006368]|uniref:hypothetical protein n=1 Tax=Streptomyces sp. NPDC006368 TaxID=3156760 RepID=UPI0033A46ADE